MAKQTGLGDHLLVGGYVIGADVSALGRCAGGPSPLEVTGITASAFERVGGRRDGGIEMGVFFNDATGRAHDALKGLPTADRVVAYLRGQAIGSPCAALVAKQINYDWDRGNDGALSGTVQAEANGFGLNWGISLTAGMRTDTAATNGTSVDTLAAASFGAQAFLSMSAFTGTDVTVKVQDSADNSSFADVTGLAFTQVTGGAPLGERIATAAGATVRRYLRAVTVTTGGVTSVTFHVAVMKNEVATVF